MGSTFFVRKEMICVLENLKDYLKDRIDTIGAVGRQFITIGSAGTGSCPMLTLLCFYLAVARKKPVAWYRHSDDRDLPSVTRLLYEGEFFEWVDENGDMYTVLRVIPASSKPSIKTQHSDLGAFLNPHVRTVFSDVLRCLLSDETEGLLETYYCGSPPIVDFFRNWTVKNVSERTHYWNCLYWKPCATSMLVLQHVTTMVKPEYFQELVSVARQLNDSRLEESGREAHFHSLIRHQESFRFIFCKYEQTDQEKTGVVTCKDKQLQIKLNGKNLRECIADMESWAESPAEMDYWVPTTDLCGTISAVSRYKFSYDMADTDAPLESLAQPFVNKQLPVCYIALLFDDGDKSMDTSISVNSVAIIKGEILRHIPLYVATYEMAAK
ncbi:hypothetical protein GN244_ATG20181 [Phytophthora infestans]|uniref:Crinkler (CRN) family protein n=1 Tax=Phytophthora infestans TaxID=4787 RepID=A0A833W4C8_PHYIN|nr:hypothetical protein GN244_ATG20181 [Phytophthora infestans]